MSTSSCFKCQGLSHIASDCPNRTIITLAEWEAVKEEEVEEEKKVHLMKEQDESQEGVVEEADQGQS